MYGGKKCSRGVCNGEVEVEEDTWNQQNIIRKEYCEYDYWTGGRGSEEIRSAVGEHVWKNTYRKTRNTKIRIK